MLHIHLEKLGLFGEKTWFVTAFEFIKCLNRSNNRDGSLRSHLLPFNIRTIPSINISIIFSVSDPGFFRGSGPDLAILGGRIGIRIKNHPDLNP